MVSISGFVTQIHNRLLVTRRVLDKKRAGGGVLNWDRSPSTSPSRYFFHTSAMAHSKWEYVKSFEIDDTLLPNSWAVARIDGRGNWILSDALS